MLGNRDLINCEQTVSHPVWPGSEWEELSETGPSWSGCLQVSVIDAIDIERSASLSADSPKV